MKFLCSIILTITIVHFSFSQSIISVSLNKEAEHAISSGLQWLEKNQENDGSWGHYPAITALSVLSFLKSPQHFDENNSIAVEKGIKFLLSVQKQDGGFYVDDLPVSEFSIKFSDLKNL